MTNDKKKVTAIILTSLSVLIELFAILLWMVPIVGFIIYIFVTCIAICMVVVGWIFSKNHRYVRIVSTILFCIYLIGIIADISLILYFLNL